MKTALELCREEFPHFDELPAAIEHAHRFGLLVCTAFENDACPSFMLANIAGGEARALFVQVKDEAVRAGEWLAAYGVTERVKRFSVMRLGAGEDIGAGSFDTDGVADALAELFKDANRAELGAIYERLIGYNPFEDSPDMTEDEVRRTLAEYLAAD